MRCSDGITGDRSRELRPELEEDERSDRRTDGLSGAPTRSHSRRRKMSKKERVDVKSCDE